MPGTVFPPPTLVGPATLQAKPIGARVGPMPPARFGLPAAQFKPDGRAGVAPPRFAMPPKVSPYPVYRPILRDRIRAPSVLQRMKGSDDDLFGGDDAFDGRRKPLAVKKKGGLEDHAGEKIGRIILRGSAQAEVHQELMFVLADKDGNTCVRASRNNAEDTLQYGAALDHQALPELKSEACDTIVGEVSAAFDEAHDEIEYYDQGNCQVFAKRIWKKITGTNPFAVDDAEDDFM